MSRLHVLVLAGVLLVAAPPVEAARGKGSSSSKKRDDKKEDKKDDKKAPQKPSAQDAAASAKKLEETLKKSEEPEEATRLAPAKLDVPAGKEVSKDALADQRRDEEIAQIQKVLPRQKSPDVIADLLFRLAEAWWEKSRYVKMAEEMPAYQKAADDWVKCRQEKGEKACGGEPRPNHRKSELYRKNAVELYTRISKEYQQYGRLDEIYYILAYNKYDYAQGIDSKKEKDRAVLEAVDSYRKLIALYPKSPFVASAYVQLGNFYFDSNQLQPARKAFDEAAKLKDPKTETYAIYKLAWCDINSGDHEAALSRFRDVVVRGTKDKDGDRVRLKTEAMRDIIKPFVELDVRDKAVTFFKDYAGQQGAWKYLKMLADAYFNAGGAKYDTAIWMYRYMMRERPTDKIAPEWQSKVVLALDKQNQRARVLDEMRVLVNNYKPGSAWYVANKSDQSAIRIAYSLTEEALYGLVTDYHQEAIKTKEVKTYKLARDIYREYIDNFPDSERAYQMRYYYAEILYALEEYQSAYEQYLKVGNDQTHDDYRKISATNMLLSAEKLVDIEAGRYKRQVDVDSSTDSGKKIDENAAKGAVAAASIKVKIDKNSPEVALTDGEKQLVAACDKYLDLVPGADDEAKVRLRAAVIYFDKIQYVAAAERFLPIIQKWPEEKTSATAAQLILEALEVKEAWTTLNKQARAFASNQRLLAGKDKDDFKKKLPVYIEGSQFKIASEVEDKEKDADRAAQLFRDFVKEFPKSKFAPIGLAKAFYVYQAAKKLDVAIEMGEKMLADYKDCDSGDWLNLPSGDKRDKKILPDLLFSLAKIYEQTADFATAAARYERFVSDYKDDDRTPDAQFNAALWYEGLGDAERSLKGYDAYMKIFKSKKAEDVKRLKLPADSAVFAQQANILERNKRWADTYEKLGQYQKQFPDEEEWKKLDAKYRQFLATGKLTDGERRKLSIGDPTSLCNDIVKKYPTLSEADRNKEPAKLAVAHCRFLQLEPTFKEFQETKFRSPSTFKADFEKKTKLSKQLKDDYGKIVEYKNGDFAIAALVRMALLPKLFARTLLDAPIPKGLDPEQEELYRATLEQKALEFEEPSIEALELALNKAFELRIYNEWTIQAEELMKEFKPDAYADVKEFPLKGSEFFFTAGQLGPEAAQ